MWRRACLAAPVLLLAACGSEPGLPVPPRPGADTLVRRPAQHLALVLADLPDGFDVGEELVSVTPTGGSSLPDAFGRLSAYAITFRAPGNRGRTGDVVSSVNAYVGLAEARASFADWQAAVPNTYRRLATPPPGAPPGAVAYVQAPDGACLLGFRSRNVVASVRVGPLPGEPLGAAGAPEQTVRLASLVLHRIDAVAGR
jgi:hypothetical protein